MSHMIYCKKLKQNLEALDYAPYPGELGQTILENISAKAWDQWLSHQTMLINEYRLDLLDPKAKELLKTEMQKFLFGDGSEKPKEYQE